MGRVPTASAAEDVSPLVSVPICEMGIKIPNLRLCISFFDAGISLLSGCISLCPIRREATQ